MSDDMERGEEYVSFEEYDLEHCPICGAEYPHDEWQLTDEITVDITCRSVYLIDDMGWGIALDHDEFAEVAARFRERDDRGRRGDN